MKRIAGFLAFIMIFGCFCGINVTAATTGFNYFEDSITESQGKNVNLFVMTADLSKGNLSIIAGVPENKIPLQPGLTQTTTGQAAAAQRSGKNVIAAINADFFNINSPQMIQPCGLTIINGMLLSEFANSGSNSTSFFGIKKDGSAVLGKAEEYRAVKDELEYAVGGGAWIIKDGKVVQSGDTSKHPRTGVGIKADGSVIFAVADGRSNISAGLTTVELAEYLHSLGAVEALNLDGGGSSTAVVKNTDTQEFVIKNKPSDGSERPVANTLMIVDNSAKRPNLTVDSEGYYLIKSFEQLNQIKIDIHARYRLAKNINASGKIQIENFNGEFDGAGYSITGLSAPIFNKLSENAHIHDLAIKGANIVTAGSAAGVAITGNGVIEKISFSGSITGVDNVGGIVAKMESGRISRCDVLAIVDGQNNVAGIAADMRNNCVIEKCQVNVNASGNTRIGGVVGFADTTNKTSIIKNCIVSGNIDATGDEPGGIGGLLKVGVENCIVKDMHIVTDSTGSASNGNVAGLLGAWCNGSKLYSSNVIISGSITSKKQCSAHRIGYHSTNKKNNYANENILINGNKVSGTHNNQEGANATEAQLTSESFYRGLGFDFENVYYWDSSKSTPMLLCIGTEKHTYKAGYNTEKHYFECTKCHNLKDESVHYYDGGCDTVCNGCEITRTANHVYDNDFDVKCNKCNAERDIPDTSSKYFSDVKNGAWYKKYVGYAVEYGMFSGTAKDKFSPNAELTRAQFVQVFANLSGVITNNNVSTGFSDVPSGKWYTGAVKWAVNKGIASGVGNNKFNPNAKIDRQQMCVMLVNYIENYKKMNLKEIVDYKNFSDEKSIAHWAKSSVIKCFKSGLVSGTGNNKFSPKEVANRATGATIFTNFHKEYIA